MTRKPWYLRRRITLAFGLTVFGLSAALSLLFGWTVRTTIQEEIDALTNEELDETQAHFSERELAPAEFAELARRMAVTHTDNPLAWRIWNTRTGTQWGEFGPQELLAHAPTELPRAEGVESLEDNLRCGAGPLGTELFGCVVVDGSAQVERFDRFVLFGVLLILVATGIATLAGGLFAGRVSGLLQHVAHSARTENAVDTWAEPGGAPEEIREVVQSLQDTLKRIREETENARLITSGMAHELRSPLQNLLGETQVTLLRERDLGEYRRVLESHLEELGELSRVVDNLVTLCSSAEARRRRSVEHFDLAAEARLRMTREFQLAQRRSVGLELLTPGPLVVEGDRESLLLALRNVVTNAIEWSPPEARVEVRMQDSGADLEILVDDAGPGVPVPERALIFQPFHRGPAARGRRVGFGLGLALTQSAVEAHGGTIEVGDSPLGGARFRIRLPQRWRALDGELAAE